MVDGENLQAVVGDAIDNSVIPSQKSSDVLATELGGLCLASGSCGLTLFAIRPVSRLARSMITSYVPPYVLAPETEAAGSAKLLRNDARITGRSGTGRRDSLASPGHVNVPPMILDVSRLESTDIRAKRDSAAQGASGDDPQILARKPRLWVFRAGCHK